MAAHSGKVYALGGFDGVQRLTSVEAYDPFHNCWTQVDRIQHSILKYISVTTIVLIVRITMNGPKKEKGQKYYRYYKIRIL